MTTIRWIPILIGLLVGFQLNQATASEKRGDRKVKLDASVLAARIDELIAVQWKQKKVPPAPRTDDGDFIRRVFLDLAGRIPSIVEMRDFLDDPDPDKRKQWIDRALEGIPKGEKSDTYSDHFATIWRTWMISHSPQGASNMEAWLRQQLRANASYDRMARELITGTKNSAGSAAFYLANENKPENLAGSTARFFLGIRLECAQCHDDRSGGSWSRRDFWHFAAFFADARSNETPSAKLAQIKIPDSNQVVRARFLGGAEPVLKPGTSPRDSLADWLCAPDNPYFARAAANRLWAYFFGIGLVDPVEEVGDHNPPSHPELLDLLAQQLAAHQFDLKYLMRAITLSRTYQLSSRQTHPGQKDPRQFARMQVRGLSAEQIFDSLAELTEFPIGQARQFERALFLKQFANYSDRATETQTSPLQALYAMNGRFTAALTNLKQNKTLAVVADQRTSTARKVETLFLMVLSRYPRVDERDRLVKYIDSGGPANDPRLAVADIYWALLNSAEFKVNR